MPFTFRPVALKAGHQNLNSILMKTSNYKVNMENSQHVLGPANRMISSQSESVVTRLCDIVKACRSDLEKVSEPAPCLVFLPEKQTSDDFTPLYQELKKYFYPLRSSAPKLIYTYGRASFLMSLTKLNTLIQQYSDSGVWLLGIDSSPAFCVQDEVTESAISINDSFFLVKAVGSTDGLVFEWGQIDASTMDKQPGDSIRFLMRAGAKSARSSFTNICLPFGVPDNVVEEWSNELHHIHNVVNEESGYLFTETEVGDLGANSGLWKLLQLEHEQRTNPVEGFHCFQLDVSNNKFRAAAALTWRV
ncbi:hypothetical protein HC752_08140 [Vibrio sp. S9_S30]|uniref:hypothetical protein n=1 Tax=Vibrio sp. S9_S30 TaxID=2720226 RepID=UPI001680F158|nr:hypothetical protein [Vibrio sp. S9_S30]MBD1556903.1 hypothetical protein [Vibrio sp. S9_S30]